MASSYQSTSFQSSASPVDTFVRQSTVPLIEDDGFSQLTKALVAVNPVLDIYMDKTIDSERQEGARIAIEEAKKGFKGIVKGVRDKNGNESARQLVGNSMFALDEYDKVSTQLLGDTYSYQAESLYNSKTYKVQTADGQEKEVPLYHFPIDSPQVQEFLTELSDLSATMTADKPADYVFEYFYPSQSKVIEGITTNLIKDHNEYNFNKLSKQSYAVITSAYGDFRDGNKESAIEKINTFMDNKVLLGVTQDKQFKFFDNVLEYSISLRDEAYTLDGINGSNDVLEMMRGIKYGPNGSSIFETHPKFLSEMHKQTIRHIKDGEAIDKINDQNKQEEAEVGILQLINELGTEEGDLPYATIQRIRTFGSKYGVDVSWIDQKIDIFKPERQKILTDFSFELTDGKYLGQPKRGSKAFGQILNSLGPLTDDERKIKTRIIQQLESSRKGQTEGSQTELNVIIQRLRKQAGGGYNSVEQIWQLLEGEKDPTDFMLKLERTLNRDFKTWLFYTDENGDGEFETRTKQDIFNYLNNAEDNAIRLIEQWKDDDDGDGDGDGDSEFKGDPLFKNREAGFFTEPTQEDIDREKALDAEEANAYIVQAGDTLTSIAENLGTTVNDIMDANNITNADLINIGQQLNIPTINMEYSGNSKQQSIIQAAQQLGIDPQVLASVISQETMGTFDHQITGGEGGNYKGLIQFGIPERKKYGYRDDMTFEEQVLGPVVRYLKDRGVKPGHGVKEVYAAILTGNVSTLNKSGLTDTDSFGTSVESALPNLSEGGSHYLNGLDFLQEKGQFLPNSN
mgnify:CR=1 FL=1